MITKELKETAMKLGEAHEELKDVLGSEWNFAEKIMNYILLGNKLPGTTENPNDF